MNIPFQIQAYLSNYKSMANSLRIHFDTQETVTPEHLGKILELHNKIGWLSFNVHQIESENIVHLPPIRQIKGQKSQSKRLRDVLYRLWEKNGMHIKDSEKFYEDYMEKLIDNVKEML